MSARKAIGKRARFAILERDGYRCRYCGAEASEAKLHVDHVLAVARGGTNDLHNLVTACQDCNLGKAALELRPIIEAQRAQALTAVIFEIVLDRFGDEITAQDFRVVQDSCLSEMAPDDLLSFAREAPSWSVLKALWLRYGGYPEYMYAGVLQ